MLIKPHDLVLLLKDGVRHHLLDNVLIIPSRKDYGVNITLQNKNFGMDRSIKQSKLWILLKSFIFPLYNSQNEAIKNLSSQLSKLETPRVLVIGGGLVGKGIDFLYNTKNIQTVSLDIYESDNVNIICDAHQLPFDNEIFDFVVIQAVLEHVINPELVVSEIYRVLKRNGEIYAETPFMQTVHEGAYDFQRFSYNANLYLFRKFLPITLRPIGGVGSSLLWILEFFVRNLFRSKIIGVFVKVLFFWLRYFDILFSNRANIEGANCFLYHGKKSTTPVKPRKIIDDYNRSVSK